MLVNPARILMSVKDAWKSYHLSLRALELASTRVRSACEGDDLDAASIEAHFGLNAVYDLHEAYFRPRGIKAIIDQDRFLDATSGYAVGALALARSDRTHQLVTFTSLGEFGDLPYGMGPFGPGWIWKRHAWEGFKFRNRSSWYASRVSQRHLWVPFDEAWAWFNEHADDETDRDKLYRLFDVQQPSPWP